MSDDFRFQNTPNPAPVYGSAVTWTTRAPGETPLVWTVDPPGVVTVSSAGEHDKNALVTAVGLGMATITARLSGTDNSISRVVGVGELFAYDPQGELHSAPSDTWVYTEPPSDFPQLQNMQSKGYGMAYQRDENRLVLNLQNLNQVRGDDGAESFFQASSTQAGTQALSDGLETYAYAPDGTLWILTPQWSTASSSPLPSDFPTYGAMNSREAALSWAPPGDLPGAPSKSSNVNAIVNVTCYLLNQSELSSPGDDTTYYTFTKL